LRLPCDNKSHGNIGRFAFAERIMSDETERQSGEGSQTDRRDDPLGIKGWVIAGKYNIRTYLGGGGFGEVYEGFNTNLPEQRVVVKFFKRVQARDKFAKEAKILCLLDHPHICRVIDFLAEEGAIVVAFIDGKDGAQILKESGPLPEMLYLEVARSMTSAMAYAHEHSIAHRDIKPGNIMVDKNNHTYLIDFGIAKEIGGVATRTGYQALTPMFAAPERQQGDAAYNPFLSDIYEMGVTLFNFCTNTMPYRNPANPNVDEWGGIAAEGLSPQLIQILRKATHPDPAKRFKQARDMADALRDLTVVYSKGRKKRPLAVVAAVLVVAAAAYFGWQAYQNRGGSATPPASVTASEQQPSQPSTASPTTPPGAVGTRPESKEQTPPQAPVKTEAKPKPAEAQTSTQVAEKTKETAVPSQTVETVTPPPPPKPQMRIEISPGKASAVYIDGRPQTPGGYFETAAGTHRVEVVHPEYPVLMKNVKTTGDSTVCDIDMTKESASTGTVDLRLALIPPSDEHVLELTLNGAEHRFTSFPVFDFVKPAGQWQAQVGVFALNRAESGRIVVDSCVTFPFGGGQRRVMRGDNGRIEFRTLPGETSSVVPFAIYWTQK
jgi:serine/threonine protein kinase